MSMLIPLKQRLITVLIYIFSWSKALPFGYELFNLYPQIKILIIPTLPILYTESLLPFGSLILFLGLFLGVVRNQNIPYFIRFNALQCLLLNIIVIMIQFSYKIFITPLGNSSLIAAFSNCIFIVMLSIILFCIYESLQGKEPDLPGISNAVRVQL